ncbi:MAG TPA: response regulator [Acetobacteraceae bacterium]|nr:response regulator [Acetobacteraceae bacterium]
MIDAPALRGLSILLVEDEIMIAAMVEDMLLDFGCAIAGIARDLPRAVMLARTASIDAALLDANLGGVSSGPVADILAARRVPFLFETGYGAHGIEPAHRTRPILAKPFTEEALVAALLALVAPQVVVAGRARFGRAAT